MVNRMRAAALLAGLALCLSGCESTTEFFSDGGPWKGPKKDKKDEIQEETTLDPVATPVPETSPLSLKAFANGPVIQFVVTNKGTRDIPLVRDDFALLVPGGRRLVRYDSFTTNLEISPWPETLRPGQSVTGRAIFHEVQDPIAYRLVVNPRTGRRSDAAFAVISNPGQPSVLNESAPVDPSQKF